MSSSPSFRCCACCCCAQADSDFHVTLWHTDDPEQGPDTAVRDGLLAARGAAVQIQILSVDYQEGSIAAAQVQVSGGDVLYVCSSSLRQGYMIAVHTY